MKLYRITIVYEKRTDEFLRYAKTIHGIIHQLSADRPRAGFQKIMIQPVNEATYHPQNENSPLLN